MNCRMNQRNQMIIQIAKTLMEIKVKPILDQRPSWATGKTSFIDLLMSPEPWKFDLEDNIKDNEKRINN